MCYWFQISRRMEDDHRVKILQPIHSEEIIPHGARRLQGTLDLKDANIQTSLPAIQKVPKNCSAIRKYLQWWWL